LNEDKTFFTERRNESIELEGAGMLGGEMIATGAAAGCSSRANMSRDLFDREETGPVQEDSISALAI
jgi:hypothetical protein